MGGGAKPSTPGIQVGGSGEVWRGEAPNKWGRRGAGGGGGWFQKVLRGLAPMGLAPNSLLRCVFNVIFQNSTSVFVLWTSAERDTSEMVDLLTLSKNILQ